MISNIRSTALVLGLAFFLTSAGTRAGQTPAADVRAVIDPIIAQVMEDKRIPGLSYAILHKGRVLDAGGRGMASLELSVPATAESVQSIASVSRIISATLTYMLAEEGALDIDGSIADYYPQVSADKAGITIRHLLSHTHGLDDFYRNEAFTVEHGTANTHDPDMLIGWMLDRPAVFAPGAHFAYGLGGSVLLQRILERITGQSYQALAEERIFAPLDMETAAFGDSSVIVPGRNAVQYTLDTDTGAVTPWALEYPPMVHAAGGLNLSPLDLVKFFNGLMQDRLVSAGSRADMWTQFPTTEGSNGYYAQGWVSYVTSEGRWHVGHEGGGSSWVIYYPDLDLGIFVLSNMSGARADALPYEIARALIAAGIVTE